MNMPVTVTLTATDDPSAPPVTVGLAALRDYANATHDPAAIALLVDIIEKVYEQPEALAAAVEKNSRDIRDTLHALHDFIRADDNPAKAWIEVVELGKFGIALRYHSGRSRADWSGTRASFTASAPFSGPLLDIGGDTLAFLKTCVENSPLPKTWHWQDDITPCKRSHLARMLADAEHERRSLAA